MVEKLNSKLEYTISADEQYAKVQVIGSPKLDEFKGFVSELTLSLTYTPGMKIVCDFSNAVLNNVSHLQYLSITTFLYSQFPRPVPPKIALVGGKSKGTLAVLKQCLVHGNVRVFYQESDALSWINLPFQPHEPAEPLTPILYDVCVA